MSGYDELSFRSPVQLSFFLLARRRDYLHRSLAIDLFTLDTLAKNEFAALERRNLVPEEETRTHAQLPRERRVERNALVALGGAGERAPRFCTAFTRLTDSGRCNDREASFQGIVAPRGVSILFLLEWLARMSCSRPPRPRVGQRSSFSNSTRLASPFLLSLSLSLSLSLASFESSLRTARISRNR